MITTDVDIPNPDLADKAYCGRINMSEREPGERKNDFELMELVMTEKEFLSGGRTLPALRPLRMRHL